MLLQREAAAWLYSEAEGARFLGSVSPLDLSADGSRVLGARSELEPSGITRHTELVAIDTRSEAERVLVRAGDRESLFPAEWSTDGSEIAYRMTTYAVDPSETKPGAGTESLCVHTLTSPDSRCFDTPGQVYSFDWSPDGESVLLAGPGSDPVLRLDSHTGATEVIISPGGDDALRTELDRLGYGEPRQFVVPQWSPSGRYIAALVSLRGGNRAYVPAIVTSAGAFVSLGKASGEFPDAFAWAPDRDVLAYTRGEAPYAITELYVHDPANAIHGFLSSTDNEGSMIPRIDGVAWSPDGRWIAFSRPNGIRVVDAEGEEPARELDVRGTVMDWAPGQATSSPDSSPSPSPSPSPDVDTRGIRHGVNGVRGLPPQFADGERPDRDAARICGRKLWRGCGSS